MSIGSGGKTSSMSLSDRGERARKSRSFDDSVSDSLHSSFPNLGFPHPINEMSQELEDLSSDELGSTYQVGGGGGQREVRLRGEQKVRFSMFRKKQQSDVSDLSLEEASPSRMPSFLSIKSNSFDDSKQNGIAMLFRRKKSDMSTHTEGSGESSPASPGGTPKEAHSRIPGMLRMSLSALRGSPPPSPEVRGHKHGREDT